MAACISGCCEEDESVVACVCGCCEEGVSQWRLVYLAVVRKLSVAASTSG